MAYFAVDSNEHTTVAGYFARQDFTRPVLLGLTCTKHEYLGCMLVVVSIIPQGPSESLVEVFLLPRVDSPPDSEVLVKAVPTKLTEHDPLGARAMDRLVMSATEKITWSALDSIHELLRIKCETSNKRTGCSGVSTIDGPVDLGSELHELARHSDTRSRLDFLKRRTSNHRLLECIDEALQEDIQDTLMPGNILP